MDLSKLTETEIRHRHRKILSTVEGFNRGYVASVQGDHSSGPNVCLKARVLVINPEGRIIQDREFESKSFLANMVALIYAGMYQKTGEIPAGQSAGNFPDGTHYGVKDTTGTLQQPTGWAGQSVGFNGSEAFNGTGAYGITLGNGTATPVPTQYALSSPITGGTGVNQMFHYGVSTIQSANVSGSTTSFTSQRVFINESAAAILVGEMGWTLHESGGALFNVMIARDLVSPVASIGVNYAFVAQYTVRVTI